MTWSELTRAAYAHGLTPPVLCASCSAAASSKRSGASLWPDVVRRKRTYYPDRILTPGFGIFG